MARAFVCVAVFDEHPSQEDDVNSEALSSFGGDTGYKESFSERSGAITCGSAQPVSASRRRTERPEG